MNQMYAAVYQARPISSRDCIPRKIMLVRPSATIIITINEHAVAEGRQGGQGHGALPGEGHAAHGAGHRDCGDTGGRQEDNRDEKFETLSGNDSEMVEFKDGYNDSAEEEIEAYQVEETTQNLCPIARGNSEREDVKKIVWKGVRKGKQSTATPKMRETIEDREGCPMTPPDRLPRWRREERGIKIDSEVPSTPPEMLPDCGRAERGIDVEQGGEDVEDVMAQGAKRAKQGKDDDEG